MAAGLFGKLPSKRDFIAVGAAREFLGVWERWVQGGISASRVRLGEGWQEAFLKAPIWRFWLGAEVSGAAVIGAFMPSVDGVGRYFPLTVFARAEEGAAIPPPEFDAQEPWFARAEELLLSALEPEATFEAVSAALATLAPPSDRLPVPPPDGMVRLPEGSLVAAAEPAALSDLLAAMRVEDHSRAYAASTFWWTIGGEGYRPLVVVGRRMPDPYLFTGMLTGTFDHVFQ
jgi:type VI secretion system protein ImpM